MTTNLRKLLTRCLFLCGLFYLLSSSGSVSDAALDGLRLCAASVLPTLFPAFVLVNLIVSSGAAWYFVRLLAPVFPTLFHQPRAGATAMILGLLGGYPLGAKTIAALLERKEISQSEAQSLLPLCNNGGISFFVGFLGAKLFCSAATGMLLYVIHVLSAISVGILFRPSEKAENGTYPQPHGEKIRLSDAIYDAAQTALTVTASIVFFSVVRRAVSELFGSGAVGIVLSGLTEFSGGCADAVRSNLPHTLKIALCSLFSGWGGICIHVQTSSVLRSSKVRFSHYYAAKLVQGIFGFCAVLLYFSVKNGSLKIPFFSEKIVIPCIVFLISAIFLLFLQKRTGKTKTHAL